MLELIASSPEITMRPTELTFEFERLQFSAMTINKSLGESLEVVGLNLSDPFFSYDQLLRWAFKI